MTIPAATKAAIIDDLRKPDMDLSKVSRLYSNPASLTDAIRCVGAPCPDVQLGRISDSHSCPDMSPAAPLLGRMPFLCCGH